jgi:8-oxo-dGTP pyrophosphatase MutT (NUDIX family)
MSDVSRFSITLTESAVREPLRRTLAVRAPVRAAEGSGSPSAVLALLFEAEDGVSVWLVRRATGMRSHSGQVAFPGGKRDFEDTSLLSTALRETHEEIGIAPETVDILGPLDDVVTGTGYVISPYVGWVSRALTPTANPSEVARIFAAPLDRFFRDPRAASTADETLHAGLAFAIDGETVWGATAAVARRLADIVRETLVAPDVSPFGGRR